jgi:uncharacterized membrane protein
MCFGYNQNQEILMLWLSLIFSAIATQPHDESIDIELQLQELKIAFLVHRNDFHKKTLLQISQLAKANSILEHNLQQTLLEIEQQQKNLELLTTQHLQPQPQMRLPNFLDKIIGTIYSFASALNATINYDK